MDMNVVCCTVEYIYNTIQYDTIRYDTIQYNTTQRNAMQCNAMQSNATQSEKKNLFENSKAAKRNPWRRRPNISPKFKVQRKLAK